MNKPVRPLSLTLDQRRLDDDECMALAIKLADAQHALAEATRKLLNRTPEGRGPVDLIVSSTVRVALVRVAEAYEELRGLNAATLALSEELDG